MKVVKMFEGVEVSYNNSSNYYPDMSVFDEYKCSNEMGTEIIRSLICNYPYPVDMLIKVDNIEYMSKWSLRKCITPFED